MKTGQFIKKTDTAIKQASYVIGRSIAREGITARHFLRQTIDDTKKKFVVSFREGVIKDIKARINGNN